MSRQFGFERLVELCRWTHEDGIAQAVSAQSLEPWKIQQTMSVEILGRSVSDVPTADISVTASRNSGNQLDAQLPAWYGTLAKPGLADVVVDHTLTATAGGAVGQGGKRATGGLVDRVRVLKRRFAEGSPHLVLVAHAEGVAKRVERHFEDLGVVS